MSRRATTRAVPVALALASAAACNAILGIGETVTTDAGSADASVSSDGSVDETRPDEGTGDVAPRADAASIDATPDGGCDADLSSDPSSCGACGHECLGGGCSAGKCQPTVLLSGLQGAGAIAVDGTDLYVTEMPSGDVWRWPKDGGVASQVATSERWPAFVALDEQYVYWADEGLGSGPAQQPQLVRLSRSQPSTRDVLYTVPGSGGTGGIAGVAADGSHVFFVYGAGDGSGGVLSLPTGAPPGTLPTTLTTFAGLFPISMAIASGSVYFGSPTNTVYRVAFDAGADASPTTVTSSPPQPIVQSGDGAHVYWTHGGNPVPADASVDELDLATGLVRALAPQSGVPGVASDGQTVYFGASLEAGAELESVAASGGPVQYLALEPGAMASVAVDDVSVYWAAGGSGANYTVYRLAK